MHRAGLLALLAVAPALTAQHGYAPDVKPASDAAQNAIQTFRTAPGLQVELAAAEPDLANPVAFTVDDRGRFFVVETHRIKFGVFDDRDHRYWLEEDLACLTVQDRIRMHKKHREAHLQADREHHERIRLLVDIDGDGAVDRATTFADGFNELEDGIAAGVLVDGEDVWFTNIPKLWRLRDTDDDGVADQREAVQDGYGVHFSLIGHDMHGLCIGPDRRLYFSIGDRGFHVEHEGRVHAHPHTGAVLRCELDGSDLEVVHTGLRNPQELAFDSHGNLFTGDNNSDGGDRARWVYVVDGGETGWHIGFQWMTDRGAWHEDRLWHPQHEDQAAYIVPPVVNLGHGPSGLAFYPGTGLPARYDHCFLLCDFRGSASHSGVYALQFAPKGASFELVRKDELIWNVLATDVEFGPAGDVYVSDWVSGWDKTGTGRLYRIRDPESAAAPIVAETAQLLREGVAERSRDELITLLRHADRRVRQRAQFALADLGDAALDALAEQALDPSHRIARLHAIWALGIRGRRTTTVLEKIRTLLADGDAEVRAQTAKVCGEARSVRTREALERLTRDDPNDRVRFFAAIALGKLRDARSVDALVELLRENHDRDAYLRHAAVMGLFRIGEADPDALLRKADHAHRSVRMGVLLALRRLGHPEIRRFVTDADPGVVREAARAIYDADIGEAMPALAALTAHAARDDVPLMRRALNAHRLLGASDNAGALAAYAGNTDAPAALRIEALRILGEWPKPHGQDRVFGDWRPLRPRSPLPARAALDPELVRIVESAPDEVVRVACETAARLEVPSAVACLTELVGDAARDVQSRDAGLRALEQLAAPAELADLCSRLDGAAPVALRKTAIRILSKLDPQKSVPVLASLVENAAIDERQNALRALGELDDPAAAAVVSDWLDRLQRGAVPGAIQLELLDAAARHESRDVALRLERFEAARADSEDPLARFAEVLEGGDPKAGRKVFFEKDTAMCVRCHTVGGEGGAAGPALDDIGAKGRDYLLASLVTPARDITEGFETVLVTRRDGSAVAGILHAETADTLELMDPEGNVTTVPTADVKERVTAGSSMPPMGLVLQKRELRDLLAFLAELRSGEDGAGGSDADGDADRGQRAVK